MKRLIAFGALACALALGACATGSASQDVEKALITTHAAYDGLSVALTTAATTGVLTGSAATQAQAMYDQVGADLAIADADWAAANPAGVTLALATAASDQAKAAALVPKCAPQTNSALPHCSTPSPAP